MSVIFSNEKECPTENHFEFANRHIGPGTTDQKTICSVLNVNDLQELVEQVIPESIRGSSLPDIPSQSENETLLRLQAIASQNTVSRSYIGMGYSACHTPSVILRNVLENPAWYTAYTPYQPEISQGRLEALLNYQTVITELTGFEIANASLLDEATAAAEAMTLCRRSSSKHNSNQFFVSAEVHPQTIEVLQTRAQPLGIKIVVGDHDSDLDNETGYFGALFQYPGTSGEIFEFHQSIEQIKEQGGMTVMSADLLSLTLLKPPAELGADIAVGSAQRFGVPLFFGGPHAAYFATHQKYKRSIPGRIIGVSKDKTGKAALRMALQTREQHIRRDKATSNICTAQALLAITAGLYAVYHGPSGLKSIAQKIHHWTTMLADKLTSQGLKVVNQYWFDTLTVKVPHAETVHLASRAKGINFRYIDAEHVGIAFDETTTETDVRDVIECFTDSLPGDFSTDSARYRIPASLRRESEFLTHEVFSRYHSETELMRYLRKLSDKDLALDRTMIPLGSCTMKLNAATEMIPISWPEFANIHPFAPSDQTMGYQELISELESMLCEATGYDAVSLQPNAGSQGEFAGLLAIQGYHARRGESHRNVCLIPQSAHGTNPASAAMAGMDIVVVNCDESGNVDLPDLRQKAEANRDQLSALMITYPSTHGVFETQVSEVCQIVHDHGGQVYIDGANLNAQVGLCDPGHYGGDVSHLNLHKTFCIPHGGGGPGVGPVAVKEHLAPFLPSEKNYNVSSRRIMQTTEEYAKGVGAVSAAPYGSAGILPISWSYIYMMGSSGLKKASQVAILNANYIATRLKDHFPVLYTGLNERVAHECILDIRPITRRTGVTVDDVAKRLIDYGFHAPTMSFPVEGTLMIEPTESESLYELDRFCDAMIQIRKEIDDVEQGVYPKDDNPLVNAPHTAEVLSADEWNHAYPRSLAAYPNEQVRENKYWAPVSRVDHAYGDRNVVCSCPPIDDYQK